MATCISVTFLQTVRGVRVRSAVGHAEAKLGFAVLAIKSDLGAHDTLWMVWSM